MKILLLFLAAFCLLLLLMGAPPGGGISLTEEASNELKVGETATIAAGETPSTGFLWSCETSDEDIVEIVSQSFRPDSLFNARPGGDGRTRYITVKALKPGEAVIEMVCKRGEAETIATRTYPIVVTSE